jgi:hypothetical protein
MARLGDGASASTIAGESRPADDVSQDGERRELALTELPSTIQGVSVELRRQGFDLPRLRSGVYVYDRGTRVPRLEGLQQRARPLSGLPRRELGWLQLRWRRLQLRWWLRSPGARDVLGVSAALTTSRTANVAVAFANSTIVATAEFASARSFSASP